ncbi:MAG TPA: hypothetical protein VFB45_23650 [Pseudolabrys sp.]|nr:hypothetical protein [Pseudolabrys sp.]
MSRWFPEVDDYEGVQKALKAGFVGALVFAGMNLLGIAFVLATRHQPGRGVQPAADGAFIAGMVAELLIVLVAAWRFKVGKGLVWGSVVLLLFAAEIVMKFAQGMAGAAWILFYAAIGAALVNGIRGAWAARTIGPEADYADVFE